MLLPIIVNKHPERVDVIIGGNQRWKILQDLGYDEIPTIEENLDLEAEKELNLRLNKNHGKFDDELLAMYFDRDMLVTAGWSEKELVEQASEYETKLNSITNDEAEMPIVPKFSEKYDAVIIFAENELDIGWFIV